MRNPIRQRWVGRGGKCDTILYYLIKRIKMNNVHYNTNLLEYAAEHGNVDDVRRLIPISDPRAHDSRALQCAARYGYTQCVELLIPVSDPKAGNNEALRWGAMNGHTQCVELLIPVSDPKAMDSQALQSAVRYGHTQCFELLYSVSDPEVALERLQDSYLKDDSIWGHLQQMVQAKRLNDVLHKEIGETTAVKVQRKM